MTSSPITYSTIPQDYSGQVPRNLKRYYGAGHLHFITCSCYQRSQYLGTAETRPISFRTGTHAQEVSLYRGRIRDHAGALSFVDERTKPQKDTPSTVMQAIKLGFTRRVFENRIGGIDPHTHHVWQARFYDFSVWNDQKTYREVTLHAPESRNAWAGERTGSVAMEQFPVFCAWGIRARENQ